MTPNPITLEGRFVRLEQYAEPLKLELAQALDVDADAWRLLSRPGDGVHFEQWWTDAGKSVAAGTGISFAVRRLSDQRIVGTTSYLNLRPADRVAEIGATFLHPDVRAGAVNPDMKQLMLAYAFDGGLFGQPANRVELGTDAMNLRSQAAIAKLGAVREGVLRRHKVTWTERVRDTVMFSIIAEEWPAVRARLGARVGAFQGA